MMASRFYESNCDGLVKSHFSLPWREKITCGNTVTYHPHPNPPPSRGRRFRTFYEVIMLVCHNKKRTFLLDPSLRRVSQIPFGEDVVLETDVIGNRGIS